jgi:hypothetical protein
MAYCSLEEAWGDSYKNNKAPSLPDRYSAPEEKDSQNFSKKLRRSRENSNLDSRGIRDTGYQPSPSVQGIIERTPPRTKKRKHSKKKKYFQRTMKRLPHRSGPEYRYANNQPNLRVSARESSGERRREGNIQGFETHEASAYDSDSGDDAFSNYHTYTTNTSNENLSKYAGSLLGSRNLRNNQFRLSDHHDPHDPHDPHDQQEEEEHQLESTHEAPHLRNPYIEEDDLPSSTHYHSSVSEDYSLEEETEPSPAFDEDDEVEHYKNTQAEYQPRMRRGRHTSSTSKQFRVRPDLTIIDNLQESPLMDRLHTLDQMEERQEKDDREEREDKYSETEEMMPPRLSTSKEGMFNIILYIVTGVFIIFILDIFVRLGKTFAKL